MSNRYSYRVEWSEQDKAFVARCIEFPSLSGHGDSPAEALTSVQEVVDESVSWMMEDGEEVPEPISTGEYRGNTLFRTTPQLHRELAIRAQESGTSINQLLHALVHRNLPVQSLDRDIRELTNAVSRLQKHVGQLEHSMQSIVPVGRETPRVAPSNRSDRR